MDLNTMIATIQIYIACVKDKEVHITPNLPKDLNLLMHCFNIADNWVRANCTVVKIN